MKNTKSKAIQAMLIGGVLTAFIACDENSNGPSEEVTAEVSSSVAQSSTTELSVAASSQELVSSSSSEAEVIAEVKLMQLTESVYEKDTYVDLGTTLESSVESGLWDLNITASGVSVNTSVLDGVVLVEKEFEMVDSTDLPVDESLWLARTAGTSVEFETSKVYITMLPGAFDHATQEYGPATYVKFKLNYDHATHAVTIQQANLDGSDEKTAEAYGYYSLTNAMNVSVEPEAWDISFGAYKTILESGTEYSVKGALINVAGGVEVALDSVNAFKDIESSESYTFSSSASAMGHSWKAYDSATKSYTIAENQIFVIKAASGKTYKLKFLSFYNADNVKGYPQFQYQEIK